MRRAFALGAILFALPATPALAGTVTADFNGDGRGDLAVGSAYENLSSTDGPEQNDNFGLSLAPRPSSYGWYWLG